MPGQAACWWAVSCLGQARGSLRRAAGPSSPQCLLCHQTEQGQCRRGVWVGHLVAHFPICRMGALGCPSHAQCVVAWGGRVALILLVTCVWGQQWLTQLWPLRSLCR